MFYTNKLENYKLGSYTDDPTMALDMGYDIAVENIEIGDDGFAYIAGFAKKSKPTNYVVMRVAEYPTIAEQLDMLYWDKINGTNIWLDTISEIKNKYPKQ